MGEIRALRELLIRVNDPGTMTPGDVAYFLGIFRELSNSLFQTLRDDPSLVPNELSDEEIRKVDAVFSELSDNFFPMAHSNKSLGELQIVERESIGRAINFLTITEGPLAEELRRISDELSQHSNEIRRDLERYPQVP